MYQQRLSEASGTAGTACEAAEPQLGPNDICGHFRPVHRPTAKSIDAYWRQLDPSAGPDNPIRSPAGVSDPSVYAGQIENLIGTVEMPIGIAGPVRVNGRHAKGLFPVPMATTEAALVASYSRGARAIRAAGGAEVAMLSAGVLRAPAFVFDTMSDALDFANWALGSLVSLRRAAEATTRHGRLIALEPVVEANIVFLRCRYDTGDASGQNMVTIATDALCRKIVETCPLPIQHWYIEGNHSGDKKASQIGALTGRGRKVTASVLLPHRVVRRVMRSSSEDMDRYTRVASMGASISGQFGVQAHFANALAAIYIATGQDAACVAEGANGMTRIENRKDGLFCSVTLPNIMVGTVGGGTQLPAQSKALEIMGLKGSGKAAAFAEVVGATCLAGEISIVAAMAAGHFTQAHARLARVAK